MSHTSSHQALAIRLITNADFGEVFIFLFFTIFFRQYLLLGCGNTVAWSLAIPVAAICLCIYVATKPFPAETPAKAFWITVIPPLIFIFLLRAPLPDVSFDVLNYRLLHSERSLRGLFYQAADFFPTAAPYNPAPDTFTGLFRHALGYRLGTVGNLLILIWSAQIIDRILREFIAQSWWRAGCVLLIMLAEQLLFEINTYMVDLIALPLMLEATRLALRVDDAETPSRVYIHSAILIGIAIALKLTNIVAAVPLLIVLAYKSVAGKRRLDWLQLATTSTMTAVALIAPVLPFCVYLWRLTGNPVFPLANKVFKSPYWPTGGGWDERWGPIGIWESVAWPVVIAFKPERYSELAVYAGRLTIGFVTALVALPFIWRVRRARWLCLMLLIGCLAWSVAGMGYSRYGFFLEILSGVAIVAVAVSIAQGAANNLPWRKAIAIFLFAMLGIQTIAGCALVLQYEWSMRPTFMQSRFGSNARYFLRDRSLTKFLTSEEKSMLDDVDIWVESSVKTTSLEALLKPNAPVLGVGNYEFLTTPEARRKFTQALKEVQGKRLATLTDIANLESSRQRLAAAGLVPTGTKAFGLRYFSAAPSFDLVLIQVEPIWLTGAAKGPAPKRQPLPFQAFDAGISVPELPASLRAGETFVLNVKLTNRSPIIWPGRQPEWNHQVTVGNFWLTENGNRLSELERRALLTRDLAPGETVELPLTLIAPQAAGNYTLKIDAVQEGVTWFGEMGSKVLELRIRVQ